LESRVEIQPGFIVKLNVTQLKIGLDSITDSKIGPISVSLFNSISAVLEFLTKTTINTVLGRGFPMQWLLDLLDLHFVKLDQTLLKPYDGYFIFYTTPTFNITTATNIINRRIVQSVNLFDEQGNIEIS